MKFCTRSHLPPDVGVRFERASLVQTQFAPDTDINRMIQRYLHGDASVLARHSGQLSNALDVPESLHDALNVRASADYLWNTLPPQVQASYGNYANFLNALDRKSAELRTRKKKSEPVEPVTPSDKKEPVTAASAAAE